MPSNVDTLLFSWKNWFGKHGSNLWNMVPACLMSLVWKEWNRHTFEDMENSLDQLKTMFALPFLIGPGCGILHIVLLF